MFFCFYFSGCVTAVSSGYAKENRNVSDFSKVDLSISADVYLIQGNGFKVEIEADNEDLDEILTEVSGNTLRIKTRDWHNHVDRAVVYITMPEIEGLSVAGSGSIIAKSSIKAGELELNVSGSGSIDINELSVKDMDATITGSGGIKVSGNQQAEKVDINITGSGSYSGNEISAGEVDVTITGSGSARVNVVEYLNTNITGSGNVNYSGRPRVNANATGSGRTRAMN